MILSSPKARVNVPARGEAFIDRSQQDTAFEAALPTWPPGADSAARTVAVLGAGSWGTALASLLARHGHPTVLWGRDANVVEAIDRRHENPRYLPGIPLPDSLRASTDLAGTVAGARWILVVVPSHAFSQTVRTLAPLLPAGAGQAAVIEQQGSGNRAALDQNGQALLGRIVQSGGAQEAYILQEGSDLMAIIRQQGNGNSASIRQSGSSNNAAIEQIGNDNSASIVQSGSGLSSSVSQTGNGQHVQITQYR